MLVETGSAALAAAVPYPGKATRIFRTEDTGKYLKKEEKKVKVKVLRKYN